MSLKVWLPLTGTLENKGTSNITVTSVNTSVATGGKIGGSSYSFNNTTSRLLIDNPIGNGALEFSMCAWVKVTQWQSNVCGIFGARTTGSGKGILCSIKSTQIIFDDGTRYTINGTYSNYENKWIHMAFIKTPTQKRVYINGELIGSQNNTSATNTVKSQLTIGNDSYETYTGNGLYGLLNDVRIYDHALSTAEVHELAQGLILHYKLTADNLINKNTLTSNCYINSSGGTTSTSNWYASDYIPVYYGNTYQSFDLSHGGSGTCVAFYSNTKTFKRSITIVANQNLTVTPNADEFYIRISIRNIAGELAIAKFVELQDVVKDSSGYGHHGTITGSFSLAKDTARYLLSGYCPSGNTDYITTPAMSLPGDQITLNFWFKSSNTTPGSNYHMPLEGTASSNQSYEMSIYKTGYLRGGLVIGGSRKVDNCTSTKLVNGNWHMCSMTYDGATIKRYVDGVMEKSTAATGSLVTSTSFVLGHYGSNTSYHVKEGYISDVRIYTTALSDADIKELYRVESKIDNRSYMHTYELQEAQSQIYPTSQGQLQCEHIEENEKASFFKDKHIETTQLIEI